MPFAALPEVRLQFLQLPGRAPVATEAVVMIHGLATSMGFWYPGAAPLLARFRPVTLYDLRGHGRSEMPANGYSPARMAVDLRDLLDVLRLERVHVVAHSFGGAIALSFALMWPERVASLVLADVRIPSVQRRLAFAEWPLWDRWRERFKDAGVEVDEEHPESGIQLLTALARLQVARREREAPALGMLGEFGRLKGRRTAMRWLELLETTTAYSEMTAGVPFGPEALKHIDQPVLVLVGEHTFTTASATALKSHCPRCEVGVIPKAGHFFPMSRPIAFARRCNRFYALHFPQGGAEDVDLSAEDEDAEEKIEERAIGAE